MDAEETFARAGTAGPRRAARLLAGSGMALGAAVLLGWTLDLARLKSVVPGWTAMNPMTAAAFIAAGVSALLLLGAGEEAAGGRALAARAFALLVAALGAVRLAGYARGVDPGVDRLLFSTALDPGFGGLPNRMAPNTAAGFVQLGAALLLLSGRAPARVLGAQFLALFVATMSLLALLGYAYGVREFYGVPAFIPMAVHTALGFALFSAAVLAAEPESGLMRVAAGPSQAARALRRLLPASVAVPAVLGWLCLRGQEAGLYGAGLATSLLVAAVVVVLAGLIYWNALLQERLEEERRRAYEALRAAHEQLEGRVRERTSELARANEELRREMQANASLQAQLLHAQKMEAVGRLAGGVAHDFNNVLTAISGHGYFLLQDGGLAGATRADVEEIMKAGERAASLTRQLLAFSRQQVLRPRVVDLNSIVRDVEKMLRRLIGEDVELCALLADGLGRVRADPGQLEQVIMNLVVNARDAMPRGGRITLETRDVELGEEHAGDDPDARPGPHVMLAVSDTGTGMDETTRARIFEPFFTTKEKGKGTGLGLSTVYGIVKQSGGSIFVRSEPGRGSTFKVLLPRVEAQEEGRPGAPARRPSPRGRETVLLVEDDQAVRRFVRRLLEGSGYRVLEAGDSEQALAAGRGAAETIHLLLTDVVMPGMRGDELARRRGAERPGMKVVFTSGYMEAVALRRVLDSRAVFIQKPIDASLLLRKLRELLDA